MPNLWPLKSRARPRPRHTTPASGCSSASSPASGHPSATGRSADQRCSGKWLDPIVRSQALRRASGSVWRRTTQHGPTWTSGAWPRNRHLRILKEIMNKFVKIFLDLFHHNRSSSIFNNYWLWICSIISEPLIYNLRQILNDQNKFFCWLTQIFSFCI